jgi:hypothetical protein
MIWSFFFSRRPSPLSCHFLWRFCWSAGALVLARIADQNLRKKPQSSVIGDWAKQANG